MVPQCARDKAPARADHVQERLTLLLATTSRARASAAGRRCILDPLAVAALRRHHLLVGRAGSAEIGHEAPVVLAGDAVRLYIERRSRTAPYGCC